MLLSLFVVGVSGAWLPPFAVAWEDATPNRSKWRPAACNAYVRIDFDRFW